MLLFLTMLITFLTGVGMSLAIADKDGGHALIYLAVLVAYIAQVIYADLR